MEQTASRTWTIAALLLLASAARGADEVDLEIVSRIKDQAFNHSRVMHHMHYLADENGPRLAGSPGYRRALNWAAEALKSEGIGSVRLETFDGIGRSWTWSHISVQMLEPQQTTLIALPVAYSAGTDGRLSAPVVYAPLWEDTNAPGQSDLLMLAERFEAYGKRYARQPDG